MKTIHPEDINIIKSIPPKLSKSEKCAIDSEFWEMDKHKLHRPTGRFACAIFCFNGKDVYVVTNPKDLREAFENINESVFVLHNSKFDIFHLRRYTPIPQRKRLFDTMLIEQIRFSGFYNDFSLADLARRYLGIYLPKEERETFEAPENDVMTQSQLEYASIDAVVTWLVYQEQRKQIDENDLNVWKSIDLPALWTILSMSGIRLDVEAWRKLYRKNKEEADAIAAKYPTINLNSPTKQVLPHIQSLGYRKLKSTAEDDLKPYKDECEFIRDLLEYRGKSKASSTYGEKWIEKSVEDDGKVYSNFKVNGAATGRFSSSDPNVENIPVKDTEEFRKCFIADEDCILIDADWSAQEPRIAAYLSCDEQLLNIFKSEKDVYIEAAKLMFGWNLTKKDPRRKERMKPTVLGASYGLTEFGMEKKYGVPKAEGEELLNAFFETFTGMAEWKKHQQKIRTYVETIYGRKYWLNPYVKGSENNALNSPVQGSAGDALKIAGYRFLTKWGWTDTNSIAVNFIHDEILLCVHESLASAAIQLLRETMIEVAEEMHEGIPAEVEIGQGKNWSEAHV